MAYSNNIITAPVSIWDVQRALGLSSHHLGTLCKSTNVNMWSKKKPCKYDSIDVMVPADMDGVAGTDNGIIMADQVKHNIQHGTFGITFPDLQNLQDLRTLRDTYVWEPPSGQTGAHLYAYRLADFANYNHIVSKPFQSLAISFSEHVFTGVLTLNTDSTYGFLMQNLDYNVYESVGFEPVLLVYRKSGSSYIYETRVQVIASQRGSKIICSQYANSTSQLTFSKKLNYGLTQYVFVPALMAYKVYYNASDPTMEYHYDPIIASSGSLTAYCGIRMPIDNETSISGAEQPSIDIGTISSDGSIPTVDTEGNKIGPNYVYVNVTFNGGDVGNTFTIGFSGTISGSSINNNFRPNNVTVSAGQSVTKQYVMSSDVTGYRTISVEVTSGTITATKSATVNVRASL